MPRPTRSLLGDSTMLRIACLLFLEPGHARSLRDIRAAMPSLAELTVIRALNDLVEQEYVRKLAGAPPTYVANESHYLAAEVRSIAVKTFGGFEPVAGSILATDAIVAAAIYGSFAKGTAGPASDIDLLLITRAGSDADQAQAVSDVLVDLSEAAALIGREINPTVYDEEEFAAKRSASGTFVRNVLDGPLTILKGSLT